MTQAQTVNLLANTAISFLANKHGVSKEEICLAINSRNKKVFSQFTDLVATGIQEVF